MVFVSYGITLKCCVIPSNIILVPDVHETVSEHIRYSSTLKDGIRHCKLDLVDSTEPSPASITSVDKAESVPQ